MSDYIIYVNFTLISALVMNFLNTVWCCGINNFAHQMRYVYI